MSGDVRVTASLGSRPITAVCAAGQEPLARDLLETCARIHASEPLTAGSRIRFGWSPLTLRDEGDGLIVCEPDFDRNPVADLRPRVATTLAVLLQQISVAMRVGAEPADVAFDDDVIARRGAIESPHIGLYREAPEPGDSGWRVMAADMAPSTDPEDFEVLPAYALVRRRPTLVALLGLPPEYGVEVTGERVLHVFDPTGADVWTRQ